MSIRSCLVPRLLVPVLAVLGPSALSAHAAPQSRLSSAITDTDRSPVRQTIPGRVQNSADLGEAASDRTLSAVTLHFSLTASQQADLTQLLADQQNPASPHYHQWLTPQQYGARFGLSSADLSKVQTWLTSKGLKIVEVSPSQNYLTVSGNIRQVESAFSTTIHSLSDNGEQHISNVTDPQLPSPIANIVTGITGLNDFKPRSHAIVQPRFTSSVTGTHFIAPGDFYAIYDVNPLLTQNINGTGISIAIVGQTDISLSDVAAFRTASGLSANAPTVVQATGYVAGTVSGDIDESQLDVEWAGAIAPNASIKFVTVGASSSASVVNALFYAISNNVAPIISMSYGNCESAWGQSNLNTINLALQQANAQGITFISASGDSGATDCDVAPPADYGLTVDFPGSSPYATSAGGTMFNEGSATGTTAYWNSNSSSGTANAGSATGYIPEAAWNESSSTGLSSGGGGASAYFTKPSWQVGTPADSSRDVPDISLNAAANHDGYLFCSQGSCTNGFRNSAGNLNVVGGTSVVAPSLAGIFALLEQQLGGGAAGRLGNINPMIYGLAISQYSGNVFHDTTSGNNSSPCQLGTTNCPSGGSIGYNAGTGYDLATGWGTVDVAQLANKWPIVPPAGTSTGTTGAALSNTTITSSSAVCSITGQLTLSISVANGSGGTLAVPTGTVQVLVDGVAPDANSTVQLSNGTASYQLSPSATTGGHTITAVYSGDGSYASSKGTLVADFVSSTKADFALTPCTTATTVNSGATAGGIAFTVTPANGFTGPVAFTVSATSSIAANYSFSAASVNVSSGTAATTTLTITAAQSATASNSHDVHPGSRSPWYVAGSGATLAGIFLLALPRRRRFTPLVALLLSVGAFSISGCGGSSSGIRSTTSPTATNAAPGTYTLNVTATAANGLVHTSVVTLKVQ
ncbi:protease pro-enzyme activation domain-containing protein [Edaphobacter modestus]|uniref:Ig-like domain-containing protein n=1 Tax=Edaphobacter modestus TaxID=388466 RepID=A0A4Q7YS84_9BACT|nr:protease pro-enzyme activation domain-containing protein [Edaphobacter modestus]RZU39759.1 Ig-like domain-containing protein [Edaphobacter modestus]